MTTENFAPITPYASYGVYKWVAETNEDGAIVGYSLAKDIKTFSTIALPEWANGQPPPDDYPLNFCCPKCDIPKCEYEQYYQTLATCEKGLKHIKNPMMMIFGKYTAGYITPGGGTTYGLNESPVCWIAFQLKDPTPFQRQNLDLVQGGSRNLATRNARFLSGVQMQDNDGWTRDPWPYDYPIPAGPSHTRDGIPLPNTGEKYDDPEGADLYYKFSKISSEPLNLSDPDDAIRVNNFINSKSPRYYAFDEAVQYPPNSPAPIVDVQVQRLSNVDAWDDINNQGFTKLEIDENNSKYMGFSHVHLTRFLPYKEEPNNPPIMVGLKFHDIFNIRLPSNPNGHDGTLPDAPKHDETWLLEVMLKYRTPKPIRFKVVCQYYVNCELNEQIICNEEVIGTTYAERFCIPFVHKEVKGAGKVYFETFSPNDPIPNMYKGALFTIERTEEPHCGAYDNLITNYADADLYIGGQASRPAVPLTFADFGDMGTKPGASLVCRPGSRNAVNDPSLWIKGWSAALGDNARILGRIFLSRLPSRPTYMTDVLCPMINLQADGALTVGCYNTSETWTIIPFSYQADNNDCVIPYKLSPCIGDGVVNGNIFTPDGDGGFGVVGATYVDPNVPPEPISHSGEWVGSSVGVTINGISIYYAFMSKAVQPPFFAAAGGFAYPLPGGNPYYLNERLFMCKGYHKWDRHLETINLRMEADLCKERLIKAPYTAHAMRYSTCPVNYNDDPAQAAQNATGTVDFKYNTTKVKNVAVADECHLVGFDESLVTAPEHRTLWFKLQADPNRRLPWNSCEGIGFTSLQDTVDCLNTLYPEYYPDKYPGSQGPSYDPDLNNNISPLVQTNAKLAVDVVWSLPYQCWTSIQNDPLNHDEAACARDWCEGPFKYGKPHYGHIGVYTNVGIPEFGGAAFSYSEELQPWPGIEPDSSSSKSSVSGSSNSSSSRSSHHNIPTMSDDGEESYNDSSQSQSSSNTSSSLSSSSYTSSSFTESSSSGDAIALPRKEYIFKVLAPSLKDAYVDKKIPRWPGGTATGYRNYYFNETIEYRREQGYRQPPLKLNAAWKALRSEVGTSLIYGYPPPYRFF